MGYDIPQTPFRSVVNTALAGEDTTYRRMADSVIMDVIEDGHVVGGVHVWDTGRVAVLDSVKRPGRVTSKVAGLNPSAWKDHNPNWHGWQWNIRV